jgi:lipopolysaccharide transport system ATP-binding protein
LEIRRGEVVGIIGRNGAGKSTLLKILARITTPTTGKITYYGRVASLLEVGTGFHRELTGRENIYLNGSILGMKRAEIAKKFDEIVAFAEVEKFIDTPVKFYSSGMYVRLAFAVAAHLDTDIMLVDEVLAVGDMSFQQKCLGKMGQVASTGRTVLFVSHNMSAIESLCQKAAVLEAGRLAFFGDTGAALRHYSHTATHKPSAEYDLATHSCRTSTSQVIFRSLRFLDGSGNLLPSVRVGESVAIELTLLSSTLIRDAWVSISLSTAFGMRVLTLINWFNGYRVDLADNTPTVLCCQVSEILLVPGNYRIKLAIGRSDDTIDEIHDAAVLVVDPANFYGGGGLPNPSQGFIVARANWSLTSSTRETLPASDSQRLL